jgi:diguanylate cyclase (GGDEF)-like protein/PAS domain S-box-containing protein
MPDNPQVDTRLLMERAPAGFSLEGLDGRIRSANPALARMLGYASAAALEGKPAEVLFAESADAQRHREAVLAGGSVTEELRFRRADGTTLWVLATSVVTGDPRSGELEILRTAIDISRQKASVEQLEREAYHDALTGLPNRRLLRIRGEQALALARRRGDQAALLFLDLIGFKGVNDHLGHRYGDAVLEQVARRIEGALRTADVAARHGGDEFLVLLSDVDGPAGARMAAARLGGHLAAPYLLEHRSVKLEARFGVALFPDHATDLEGLLWKADQALAEAKRQGGPVIRLASGPTNPAKGDGFDRRSAAR